MALETDFNREAGNLSAMASELKHFPRVNAMVEFPTVFTEVSTRKVLTMSFVDGVPVYEKKELDFLKVNPSRIAKALVECWAVMIFALGRLHCDPHPGNFLVSKKSKKLVKKTMPKKSHRSKVPPKCKDDLTNKIPSSGPM